MKLTLAHFSDIHLTAPPIRSGFGAKRWLGALNYYVGLRERRFRRAAHRIERLLQDIDALEPDHVLCTGDLTAMSYPVEFEKCSELFGERLTHPERYTVIPGNHDRYTGEALRERLFERWFGTIAPPNDAYPFVKEIGPQVVLVLVDSARPTRLFDSSGRCGERQLTRLREILRQGSLRDAFVLLAIHYGIYRENGRFDHRSHQLRDAQDLLDIIDADESFVDIVLHGHNHEPYVVRSKKSQMICVGSATDLRGSCGYNLYEIDAEKRWLTIKRRVWSPERDAYVPE